MTVNVLVFVRSTVRSEYYVFTQKRNIEYKGLARESNLAGGAREGPRLMIRRKRIFRCMCDVEWLSDV